MTKHRRFTKEFEDEVVRLVTTGGRTQREVAEDLGVGLSTLVRWISRSRDRLAEMPDAGPQADTAAELKRLRRENGILRQERDILKWAIAFLPGREIDEVQFVDRAKKDFPVHCLCRVLGISQSGYLAWKDRPAGRRQRDDMVMLSHVRSAFALSNGTVACPGPDPGAVRA